MLLIYKRNISGPNTVPCGTPDFTLTKSNASLSTAMIGWVREQHYRLNSWQSMNEYRIIRTLLYIYIYKCDYLEAPSLRVFIIDSCVTYARYEHVYITSCMHYCHHFHISPPGLNKSICWEGVK